jgi:hypothetical protein
MPETESTIDLTAFGVMRDDGNAVMLSFYPEGEATVARLTFARGIIREQRLYPELFPRGWRNTAIRRMHRQPIEDMTPRTLITEKFVPGESYSLT